MLKFLVTFYRQTMFTDQANFEAILKDSTIQSSSISGEFSLYFHTVRDSRFYISHFVVNTAFKPSNFMNFLELEFMTIKVAQDIEAKTSSNATIFSVYELKKKALSIPDARLFSIGEENMTNVQSMFPNIKLGGIITVSKDKRTYERFNSTINRFKKDMLIYACDDLECAENYILKLLEVSN